MKIKISFLCLLLFCACAHRPLTGLKVESGPWCGLHLLGFGSDSALVILEKQLPSLVEKGVNVLILEVDYGYEFQSHPELRGSPHPITRNGAQRLAQACRRHHIRLVPEFQCLGHQSWAGTTFALLTRYPELDMTPGAFPGNQGIYCREWDPLNPTVNEIVFALIDEIIDAFDAEMFHVGMDEVFLIGHEKSPSTFGHNPASVFARAVNDLHGHLCGQRQKTMLMWGDRLIDGSRYHYGSWEGSTNGTAAAVDSIPKDIIICDRHYELREEYASVPMFLEKGFRVLPTSWKDVDACRAFMEYSQARKHPAMLGHLFTRWSAKLDSLADFPPLLQNGRKVRLFQPLQ
jgi:hypothetical protein